MYLDAAGQPTACPDPQVGGTAGVGAAAAAAAAVDSACARGVGPPVCTLLSVVTSPPLQAGLHIKDRSGKVVQAVIPANHVGFQVGETLQVGHSITPWIDQSNQGSINRSINKSINQSAIRQLHLHAPPRACRRFIRAGCCAARRTAWWRPAPNTVRTSAGRRLRCSCRCGGWRRDSARDMFAARRQCSLPYPVFFLFFFLFVRPTLPPSPAPPSARIALAPKQRRLHRLAPFDLLSASTCSPPAAPPPRVASLGRATGGARRRKRSRHWHRAVAAWLHFWAAQRAHVRPILSGRRRAAACRQAVKSRPANSQWASPRLAVAYAATACVVHLRGRGQAGWLALLTCTIRLLPVRVLCTVTPSPSPRLPPGQLSRQVSCGWTDVHTQL